MQRRQVQKRLERHVLQNKIRGDLLVIGKSALKQLIADNANNIDFVISKPNSNDKRTKEIIELAQNSKILTYLDQNLLDLATNLAGENFSICAILRRSVGKTYSLRDLSSTLEEMDKCLGVAFGEIDYEQNLGAMIRTCAAMGVDFILVPNSQQKVFSTTVTKVSMGYNYLVPVIRENFLLALDELAKLDFDIVGMDMKGENIQNMRYNPRVCFVMGNEAKGLSEAVLAKTTKRMSIPMSQDVESLNVSVSLGIALYDYNLKTAIHIQSE